MTDNNTSTEFEAEVPVVEDDPTREEPLRNLGDALRDALIHKVIDRMYELSVEEGTAAVEHRQWAAQAEAEGNNLTEMKHMLRAIYHQNEAIMCAITGFITESRNG